MVNVFVSVDVERGIGKCEGLQLNVCSEFLFFITDSSGAALCDRDQNKQNKNNSIDNRIFNPLFTASHQNHLTFAVVLKVRCCTLQVIWRG